MGRKEKLFLLLGIIFILSGLFESYLFIQNAYLFHNVYENELIFTSVDVWEISVGFSVGLFEYFILGRVLHLSAFYANLIALIGILGTILIGGCYLWIGINVDETRSAVQYAAVVHLITIFLALLLNFRSFTKLLGWSQNTISFLLFLSVILFVIGLFSFLIGIYPLLKQKLTSIFTS